MYIRIVGKNAKYINFVGLLYKNCRARDFRASSKKLSVLISFKTILEKLNI